MPILVSPCPVQPDYMQTIEKMTADASPDTVFLLDTRIALPGMMEGNALEEHMLRLRNIAPASWERTSERELPSSFQDVAPKVAPLSDKDQSAKEGS